MSAACTIRDYFKELDILYQKKQIFTNMSITTHVFKRHEKYRDNATGF